MDIDLSVYLGPFLDEVDEQLEILEGEVLNLEQDSENAETIQNIFRAAHTLKGSSAAMGMDKMKELTHKVENVFDSIRNNELQVNTNMINVIFACIDMIKQLKEAILNGTLETVEISDLIEKLDSIQDGTDVQEKKLPPPLTKEGAVFPEVILDEYQRDMVKKAFDLEMNVVVVYVALHENTMLKSVRAFLIHNNLKEIGEIIATFPTPEIIEDEEQFEGSLAFIVVTDVKSKEILKIVNSISDIKTVHLTSLTPTNLDSYCEGKKVEVMEKKSNEKEDSTIKTSAKAKIQQTVRIDIDRLEHLMNLVGELVISQTRLADIRSRLADRYSNDLDMEGFQEVSNHLGQTVSELQEGMMKTRMLPIEQLFNRFPRMVRDIAQKSKKEIQFLIEGKETELDRSLIEEIADPIIHLLRNSLDHGIELPEEREQLGKPRQGTVLLKAAHEESHIVITISDDGKGIDGERIKQSAIKKGLISEEEAEKLPEKDVLFLIFKSGVSTAKKVTDISGRGVGMDIVRSHIEKLNGLIDIDTEIGKGTTFTIKLPLTLAIIRSLLVQIGKKQFALPLANVQEIIRLHETDIKTIQDQDVGIVRDRVLPLVRLHHRLGADSDSTRKRQFVVVIGLAEKRVGIIIDRTLGNQEVVIKSLGKYIGTPKYISGATIMGDGNVALILDVGSIVAEEGARNSSDVVEQKARREEEEIIQVATFMLGNEEYAIDIHQVKDIIIVPSITPIINSPFSVMGMINLRGKLIPVMDLRERFQKEKLPLTRKSRIMVVDIGGEKIGLLVDKVTEVLRMDAKKIEESPKHDLQIEDSYIKGIYHKEDRLIILLEIDRFIQIEKLLKIYEENSKIVGGNENELAQEYKGI